MRISASGVELEVAVRGEGPLVVLYPGCGRLTSDFDPLVNALCGAGYRTAVVSPRGVGGSVGELEGLTLHDYAADVAAVIRALGDGPAHVVGHALGNRIARCLAADSPELVRSLVLLAAGGMIEPTVNSMQVWRAVISLERDDPKRVRAIHEGFFAPSSDPAAWLDWHNSVIFPQSCAAAITPLEEWWPGGSAPMLVVQGKLDLMAPPENARRLREQFPHRVRCVEIEDAAHALIPEQPEKIISSLLAWIEEQEQISVAPPKQAKAATPKGGALGDGPALVDYLQQRTAAERAGFLLRELRPGMRLLDCGCGPGSMTIDLAAAVAPGEVIGIDLNPRMIDIAVGLAGQRGAANVRFETADVYSLPFEDESFDVVFLHTLLMHLERPVDALIEARRVLRSGGMVAVCDGDWAADIQTPTFTLLEQASRLAIELMRMNGTNVHFGRRHRSVLRQAGFSRIRASATVETYGTAEATRDLAEINVRLMSEMAERTPLPVDPMAIEFLTRTWQAWGNHPDAFFSRMRAEALAWKE